MKFGCNDKRFRFKKLSYHDNPGPDAYNTSKGLMKNTFNKKEVFYTK